MTNSRKYLTFLYVLSLFLMLCRSPLGQVNLVNAQTDDRVGDVYQLDNLDSFSSLTYHTGGWDIDYTKLRLLTESLYVAMNMEGFSKVIEEYFLPLNMRFVGLHMQWDDHANTSTTDVRYLQWVDDWLTASDNYGIANIFYIRQWGSYYAEWDNDLLNAKPELQNLDKDGNPVPHVPGTLENPIALGPPEALEQYEDDLRQLYEYYGHHPSWIGFGGYHGDRSHYGAEEQGLIKNSGFHPYHLEEFTSSKYFSRDIDENGFHLDDGTKCKLWEMYVENPPLFELKSGDLYVFPWTQAEEVYGNRMVALKFMSPESLNGFQIKWYGYRLGFPSNLTLELYRDDRNDFPLNLGNPIETVVQSASLIGSSSDWQGPVVFTSLLAKGDFYWVIFRADGDASNNYLVYRSDFRVNESHVKTTEDGYAGPWIGKNNAFIWLQDLNGTNKKVHPYQQTYNRVILEGQTSTLTFNAPKALDINVLFLYLADRAWANDPTPIPVRLVRVIDDSTVSTGEINPTNFGGVYWWTPVPLNEKVTLNSSEQYRIEIGPNPSSILLQLLAIRTNPSEFGFQGQEDVLLFALADMKINPDIMNYDHIDLGPNGDPITYTNWVAIGFQPTVSSKLASIELKIGAKTGTPSDLAVSLYSSKTTNEEVGIYGSPDIELERMIVPAGDVTTGWLSVSGWISSLSANTPYWIVLSQVSSSSGEYRLWYKTNSYRFPVVYTRDSGTTWRWGFPIINTPADVVARIATEAEVWRGEPEDVEGFRIRDNEWLAQSFRPSSDITVRGALLFMAPGFDGYNDVTVELRTDSGSDSPSSTILSSTKIKPGIELYSSSSLALADFKFPVDLTSGEKYWLVIRSVALGKANVLLSFYREPAQSFGGTTYKAKRSTDGGYSWNLPNGNESDIVFSLIEPNVIGANYNVSILSDDILAYHAHKIKDEPLHGWNTYLNILTTRLLKELVVWFEGYTGRAWVGLDVNNHAIRSELDALPWLIDFDFGSVGPLRTPPTNDFFATDLNVKLKRVLNAHEYLPWSSLGQPQDNLGYILPEQIGLYYRLSVPQLARSINIFDWASEKLIDDTQQVWSRDYGEILNRMRNVGWYFGSETKAVKVLWMGTYGFYGPMLKSLTPALDITTVGSEDPNFTRIDFTDYDVIIWGSFPPGFELTSEAINRVEGFVSQGGGFVAMSDFPDWANEILGLNYTGTNIGSGSISYVNYSHPIIRPFTDISGYVYKWSQFQISDYTPSPATTVVYDDNNNPWIAWHNYEQGRGVFVGTVDTTYPSDLDGGYELKTYKGAYPVLLTNGILFAAREESMIPAWWYSEYSNADLPWHKQLWYSINGRPGRPILLWLSNNNETTNFDIHLNASFYGINPLGWLAIDVQNWEVVAKGSGTDIKINTTVPALSWKPIYIVNATSNLQGLYSNTFIISQTIGNNNATYTIKGPCNQTSWLITNSTEKPASVLVNNTGALSEHTIYALNASDTLNGWYYDSSNQLLYIKFKTTSTVLVKVEQPQPPVSMVSLTVQVKDASTNAPIFKALIYLENDTWTSATKTTDAYGLTSFTGLQTGTYTIVGSSEGYLSREETVTLIGNTTHTLLLTRESSADGATPSIILASALIPLVIAAIIAIVVSARLIQNRRRESKV